MVSVHLANYTPWWRRTMPHTSLTVPPIERGPNVKLPISLTIPGEKLPAGVISPCQTNQSFHHYQSSLQKLYFAGVLVGDIGPDTGALDVGNQRRSLGIGGALLNNYLYIAPLFLCGKSRITFNFDCMQRPDLCVQGVEWSEWAGGRSVHN